MGRRHPGTKERGPPFVLRRGRSQDDEVKRRRGPAWLLLACAMVSACSGDPLQSVGLRSSEWINEPTVPSTVPVITTTPTIVAAGMLSWSNDQIPLGDLADPDAVLAQVFARREGDRFIQASRFEIAAVLPDVGFPAIAPQGAEWVTSQLVFDNDGALADNPTAAFGIWSAEPYTRSRTVAQMAIFTVARDEATATDIASGAVEPSCAQFSDRTTDSCEVVTGQAGPIWLLGGGGGTTLVWFEGTYRYELFGRSFVPLDILEDMSADMSPLASIGLAGS